MDMAQQRRGASNYILLGHDGPFAVEWKISVVVVVEPNPYLWGVLVSLQLSSPRIR